MAEALELKRESGGESLLGSLLKFGGSAVGSKVIMALTGLGLGVFIIAHLAGNLTAFAGHDTFNHYAEALKGNAPLLWGVRLALLLGFPLHIATAIRAARINRAARPVAYAYASKVPASSAGKTMIISGMMVAAYFCFHLAHFTLHVTGPQPQVADPYNMLVMGFQQPLIAGAYVGAMVLLALHLSHGIYSLFQHLGAWGKQWTPFLKTGSLVLGYGICAAFAAIPLSVLLGFIK